MRVTPSRVASPLPLALLLACFAAGQAMARPLDMTRATIPASEVLTVSSIEPAEGSEAGGTKVKIKGTGFVEGATVTIGSAATSVVVANEKEITATTTAHAAGPQEVVVKESSSTSTGGPTFTYVPLTVSSIEPAEGSEAGGTKVKIKGTGFVEGATVTIGSAATSVVVANEKEVTATTSAHAAGPQEVVVKEASLTSTGGPTFTYREPLTVSSIEPAEGSEAGGTKVKIKGTGFVEGATVTIGSAATSVVVANEKEITATTTAHAAGPQEVVVKESSSTSTGGPTFTYVPPPSVTAVAPPSGPESGGTEITITGENLAKATAVRFGATSATSFEVVSVTSIRAISPPGSGTVDVTVTTAGGTSPTSAADSFAFTAPPPPPKEKESTPPPKESPPPPPAATCTMKPIFLTIERKHRGKARPKIAAGQLRVTVTCTDSASVSLAGRLSMAVGKKPKHGKQRKKAYALEPSTVSVAKGVGSIVALKLPLKTVVALVAKAKESVKITLNATSAGGSSHNAVSIKQLRV